MEIEMRARAAWDLNAARVWRHKAQDGVNRQVARDYTAGAHALLNVLLWREVTRPASERNQRHATQYDRLLSTMSWPVVMA